MSKSNKKSFRCIIAGTRNFYDYLTVVKAINSSGFAGEITEVVSGQAYGVDSLGERWALSNKIPIKSFPADWSNISLPDSIVKINKKGEKYNAKAGFIRNETMAQYADALIAVIKDDSPGTSHMIKCMKDLNKKVYIWEV